MVRAIQQPVVRETRNNRYKSGKVRIPELLIARLWQKRAARQADLRTEGGARLRVLYPGRSSGAAGPDFRDALLEIEGVGLVRGDVEIHLHQRDWVGHGHREDPNYNGVVLHAVVAPESPTTALRSGRQAPVVSLAALMEDADSPEDGNDSELGPGLWEVLGLRGYPEPDSAGGLGDLLDRAGDDRFLAKSNGFSRFLEEQDPDQTLYEGLMEGLGYRFNQQPFLKLAARTPYAALERGAQLVPKQSRAQAIDSWLLTISGLIPIVQSEYVPLPRVGFGAPLALEEWHRFRVRPSNHPRKRIAGAAALLDRFLEEGVVSGLRRTAEKSNPRELISVLTVAGGPGGKDTLIGRGRAGDLAVNVVLPFLHAFATGSKPGFEGRNYLHLYHRFSKLQENELTKEMAGELLDPDWRAAVTNARRQQGLLHLQSLVTGAH